MIKKLKLIGLAVILLQGLGMIHSVEGLYIRDIGTFGYNPYYQSQNIRIMQNGTMQTEELTTIKNILILNDNTSSNFKRVGAFFRTNNGLPYYIGQYNGNVYQGELTKYYICDELISTSATNCIEKEIDNTTVNTFSEFLKNVDITDVRGFEESETRSEATTSVSNNNRPRCKYSTLCISSNKIGKSICFIAGVRANNSRNSYNCSTCYCKNENIYQISYELETENLINNERLNYLIGKSPGDRISSNTTPTNYICPTIGELKKQYGLQEDVCYAGYNTTDMRGDNSTYGKVKGPSIFEVYEMYSGGMTLRQRYETYTEYYNNINTNTEQFTGRSKVLLGIFFARQVFGNEKSSYNIINYCNLVTSGLSDNTSSCVASTGSINQYPVASPDEIIEDILKNPKNRDIVLPGNTNTNGSGDIEGDSVYSDIVDYMNQDGKDMIEIMQSIYSKITGIFTKKEGKNPIIPQYIAGLILLIVLFKIFKK